MLFGMQRANVERVFIKAFCLFVFCVSKECDCALMKHRNEANNRVPFRLSLLCTENLKKNNNMCVFQHAEG